jgi:heme-binding protein
MKTTAEMAHHRLRGVFAVTALGGAAVATMTGMVGPSATAGTDPCAASEIARTVGTVANNTGGYLDSHPETNQALTTISQQPAGPASIGSLKTYFDANPQVGKDLQGIQQPLLSLSTQCKLPISLPQILGLLSAAQSQAGGLPTGGLATGGLPTGGLPTGGLPTGGLPTGALSTGVLPGGVPLPAGLSAAQAVAAPGAVVPALPAPAVPAIPVTGPLPGPATTTTG